MVKKIILITLLFLVPLLYGCSVSSTTNERDYESEISILNYKILNLNKSLHYYKNYSFNCYNLSKSKDEIIGKQNIHINSLIKEAREKEIKNTEFYYNEIVTYKNYNWTGCKDSRTIRKFCKGCNWDITCTGSMRPTFSCENTVYFCSASKNEIKIGDIIAFLTPEYTNDDYETFYTLHRVINITSKGYITKGDFNSVADNFVVPYRNILGKLWKVEG